MIKRGTAREGEPVPIGHNRVIVCVYLGGGHYEYEIRSALKPGKTPGKLRAEQRRRGTKTPRQP